MKTKLILLLVGLIFAPMYSFATNAADNGEKKINYLDMVIEFCDDNSAKEEGEDSFVFSAGDDETLCFTIENVRDTPLDLSLNFVDAASPESEGLKEICLGEEYNSFFEGNVSGLEDIVSFAPGEKRTFNAQVNFPLDVAGLHYGCITVIDQLQIPDTPGGGLATILRRANGFKFYVDAELDVGLEVTQSPNKDYAGSLFGDVKLFGQADGEGYLVSLGVDNIGDLPQSVTVVGDVIDVFGNAIPLEATSITVGAKEVRGVDLFFGDLPWYKLWYTVDLTVTHHAMSDIKSEFITDELLSDHVVNVSETFFLFPRWLVIALGALIVLIGIIKKMFASSKRKHQHEMELEEELKRLRAAQ